MIFVLAKIRSLVTLLVRTVTLGLLACNEIKTFAGVTPLALAILPTTSFFNKGEFSEPKGE